MAIDVEFEGEGSEFFYAFAGGAEPEVARAVLEHGHDVIVGYDGGFGEIFTHVIESFPGGMVSKETLSPTTDPDGSLGIGEEGFDDAERDLSHQRQALPVRRELPQALVPGSDP